MNKKEQMIFSVAMGGLGMLASTFAHKPEIRYGAMIGTAALTAVAVGYELSLPDPLAKKDAAKGEPLHPNHVPQIEEPVEATPVIEKTPETPWWGADEAEPVEEKKEGWKMVLTPQDNPFFTPI